ncbi:SWIM zinc finger family protein [Glycomyces sp. L485]|uniref:SWIM zinc finger family protein n=1 Tax=Glycomyces sp. L485 TaxID=2909235 RepID=UPI001F4ADE04|nr:SWIM zinc finger family protein [Glycomyces sp. L485]MCH7231068.1 SWIM zinc finger family protein [Glycomyces sp. L485]
MNEFADRFAEYVEAFLYDTDSGRIARGRSYARSGAVGEFEVDEGFAAVQVRGSRGRRYSVALRVTEFGDISGRCDCPDGSWICKHIVAALFGLIDEIDRNGRLLRVLHGMEFPESADIDPAPEDSGRTRWAAEAYENGPTPAEAFARTPAALPEPPPVPAEPEQPCFHLGPYDPGRFTDEIDADGLDLQAAVAANSAYLALDAAEHEREIHPRPDDPKLDAARVASFTGGLISELAAIAGCPTAEMHDHARAWYWGGAEGVAVLTGQWKPEPAASKAADERLAGLFGTSNRRLNRWTIPSLNCQLRLAEDGRWHPYTKTGNRWAPAGPPAADLETAAEALQRQ